MERNAESILINRNDTISWINREINISLKQIEKMQRYQKVREEGYISALKKIQAKLRI